MKRFIKGYVIGIVASMAIAIVPTAAIAEEVVPPSGNDEAIQSVEVADVSSLQEPAGQVAMDPEAENGITASALAPVTAEEGGDAPVTPEPTPTLTGSAHVQTFGWQPATAGEGGTVVLGTTGLSKRLEGLALTVEGGSISYKAHVQTYGWQDWRADGVAAGTEVPRPDLRLAGLDGRRRGRRLHRLLQEARGRRGEGRTRWHPAARRR